jgi:hypothetical protein
MARNGSGTYSLPVNTWNPAVNGVAASSADWQSLINDVASALTASLAADGQTPMTGNLAMGGNRLTGLAAGTATGNSLRYEQVFGSSGLTTLAASGGSDLVGFLQTGAGAVTRTGQAKLRESVSVKDFGAVGDGVADDTAAIQLAIDAVCVSGGRLVFPVPGIYRVTSEITVTSDYPVVIESWMGPNNAASPASYISIGAAISGAVFDISSRGGCVRGLWFRDPTSSLGFSQGTRAINQALKLTVFGMGTVENCAFDGLLGSAIETNNMIRGHLNHVHVRDCGTPSRPAIYLNGVSDASSSQAITILSPHVETCYGEYVHINQYSPDTKIIGGQFEADTSIAATCMYFVYNNGNRTKLDSCGFNRNTNTAFYGNSNRAQLSNCTFNAASGALSLPKVHFVGSFNQVTGCFFSGTVDDVGTSINDAGGNNFFSGCHVYFGGNVILGTSSVWSGGGCFDLQTTETYAINCAANSTVTGAYVSGSDVAGGILAISGVVVSGCNVISNAGFGIRCQATTAVIQGNRASGNTAGDYSFTAYPHAYSPNANQAGDGVYPLQASTTWNPASISNGASESVNVTVTGAALGDNADASFPMLVSGSGQNGMQLSASVYTANTVRVTVSNNSGGSVDLDSGTLVVKVVKQ